jgi:hypothetical protein
LNSTPGLPCKTSAAGRFPARSAAYRAMAAPPSSAFTLNSSGYPEYAGNGAASAAILTRTTRRCTPPTNNLPCQSTSQPGQHKKNSHVTVLNSSADVCWKRRRNADPQDLKRCVVQHRGIDLLGEFLRRQELRIGPLGVVNSRSTLALISVLRVCPDEKSSAKLPSLNFQMELRNVWRSHSAEPCRTKSR